jgi:hypothetical protein
VRKQVFQRLDIRSFFSVWGLWVMVALASGCGKSEDEFLIEGQLDNYAEKKIVLHRMEGKAQIGVDSMVTGADGSFHFQGKAPATTLYQLMTTTNQNILLVPEKAYISVRGDALRLSEVQVEGGQVNTLLQDFRRQQLQLYSIYMANVRKLSGINRETELEVWRKAEAATDIGLMGYLDFLRAFTDTTSVPLLRGIAGMSLDVGDNYYRYGVLTNRMERELPNHVITQTMRKSFEDERKRFFAIQVDDFDSETSKGDTVHFNRFHGKVTLLYVWASYCEFSRRENKRLSAFLRAHPQDDFQVVGYSIDTDRDAWRAALAADSLAWDTHLISPDGLACYPVSELGVQSIPFTYLLDRKGILRSKKVFTQDLAEDLDSLLKIY